MTDGSFSKGAVDRAGALWRDLTGPDRERPLSRAEIEGLLDAATVIDWWRQRHARPLATLNANVRYYLDDAGTRPHRVTQRLKRFPTIVDKLRRFPRMALTQMEDIGGLRAILPDQDAVDQVATRLRRRWDITRDRDYARDPKDDGYRATHLIVRRADFKIELQLRTPDQNLWAQSVEEDTRFLGLGLKFGSGPPELMEYYRLASELIAMREGGIQPDATFLEKLRLAHEHSRRYL